MKKNKLNIETKELICNIVKNKEFFIMQFRIMRHWKKILLYQEILKEVSMYAKYIFDLEQFNYFNIDIEFVANWLIKFFIIYENVQEDIKIDGFYDLVKYNVYKELLIKYLENGLFES